MTCFVVALLGVSTNILQASLFGFAGQLPTLYTQALMAGNGIAGVLVCLLRMATKAETECKGADQNTTVTDAQIRSSTIAYFASGGVILVVCCVCYVAVVNMQFTKYYVGNDQSAPQSTSDEDDADKQEPLLPSQLDSETLSSTNNEPEDGASQQTRYRVGMRNKMTMEDVSGDPNTRPSANSMAAPIVTSRTIRLARERRAHSDGNEKLSTAERLSFPLFVANLPANTPRDQVEGTPRGFSDEDDAPQPSGKCANALLGPWSILKRLWMLAVQVFLIFSVTLSLFPGQVNALPFNHHADSKWFQDMLRDCGSYGPDGDRVMSQWWGISLFVVFNVFDFTGRMSASLNGGRGLNVRLCFERGLWAVTIGRFLVVPFMLVATHGANMDDYLLAASVAVMAVTNGYVSSVMMMYGPAKVKAEKREMAGIIMSCFLQFGILGGTGLAFVWVNAFP